MKTTWPLFLCCAASALIGCAHQSTSAKLPPDTAAASPGAGGTKTTPDRVVVSCEVDGDCGSSRECVNKTCVDGKAELDACTVVRVHFRTGSSEIEEKDHGQLERAASCLRASHSTHVIIAGNADERGGVDLNLTLGDRRAESVAHYLEKLGATTDQIRTISYGRENPVCSEHDEKCWARNRSAGVKATSNP